MENMSYMSTSFQSSESSAPVYDLATDHDNQLKPSQGPHNGPKGSMYSELGEYARLSHSGPSTEKILRPHCCSSVESDQHSPYESSQLYDTADVSFNQPTDNNGRGQDTYTVKSQQSVQYTAGKGLQVVTIVLLALILMLLVCVLVVLLLKDSCTCDTSSNSAGLTNSGNTAINSNLSLIQNTMNQNSLLLQNRMDNNSLVLQNKINDLMEWCATKNSSLLLQSNVEYIMEQINDHNANSNLSLIQDTMNQNSLLLQNKIDNNSLVLQNKMVDLMEQIKDQNANSVLLLIQKNVEHIKEHCATKNSSLLLQSNVEYIMEQINDHNPNSNLSLIQDTMNSIIQQIMVHANNTNRSTDELLQLLNTSLIKNISIPTAAAVNDVLLIVNELLEIQNGSSLFNSIRPISCKNIKTAHPNSPSGYYYVNSHNIYCNMGELCGQDGGWTRIAYLDMTENCPSGLQELITGGIRVCRREGTTGGCRSNIFQTNGISYSQICGKVVGYQKGTTDGVLTNVNDINGVYLDGVSITRGSPRKHVWSYIAGYRSDSTSGSTCPCNTGVTNTNTVQSFVGEDYYCESGTDSNPSKSQVYSADPLWDGNNCPSKEAPCCTGTGLPWFFRDYGNAIITDYIELRVCGNSGWNDEDTPVQLYEIYVK